MISANDNLSSVWLKQYIFKTRRTGIPTSLSQGAVVLQQEIQASVRRIAARLC